MNYAPLEGQRCRTVDDRVVTRIPEDADLIYPHPRPYMVPMRQWPGKEWAGFWNWTMLEEVDHAVYCECGKHMLLVDDYVCDTCRRRIDG